MASSPVAFCYPVPRTLFRVRKKRLHKNQYTLLSLLNNESNLSERFTELGIDRGSLVNPDVPDTESVGLSHPYYWAPFILIGNNL